MAIIAAIIVGSIYFDFLMASAERDRRKEAEIRRNILWAPIAGTLMKVPTCNYWRIRDKINLLLIYQFIIDRFFKRR